MAFKVDRRPFASSARRSSAARRFHLGFVSCGLQTSGYFATKLPLTLWFAAIQIVTAKNGVFGTRPPAGDQAADGLGKFMALSNRWRWRRQGLRRQAGPGRSRQDALRPSCKTRSRAAHSANGRHRRPRLLARARRGRLQPCPIRTGSGPKAARVASFKFNTTLGNIKSAITGTYRKLGPDHAERYLLRLAYNRRYHLHPQRRTNQPRPTKPSSLDENQG